MFHRFTNIVNDLNSLEKTYPNVVLVYKFLDHFPNFGNTKVTAVQEIKF